MTATPFIAPREAARLIEAGAVLIDIREADERVRLSIPGSRHLPLSGMGGTPSLGGERPVIFHCRSGARTAANATRLRATTSAPVHLLDGGIEAWRAADLPVATDPRQPIEVMRQVQIVAGLLILAGMCLGALVSPRFYALSTLVGAGLTLAGITGWCGMAHLLRRMPWNRRAAASV